MKNYIKFSLLLLAVFSISLSSCKKKGCTDPTALNYDADAVKEDGDCKFPQVTMHLHQMVGDKALVYGDVYDMGSVKVKFSLFQYYLSGVHFMTDGVITPILEDGKNVYILSNPDKMMFPLGQTTVGHRHMLAFGFGIDAATNDQSEVDFAAWPSDHPLSLQSPAMHWSWLTGYIFMKIEGKVDVDGDGTFESDIVYHVGTNGLFRDVKLTVHADIDDANEAFHLELDAAKILSGLDLTDMTQHETHTQLADPAKMLIATKIVDQVPAAFSVKK